MKKKYIILMLLSILAFTMTSAFKARQQGNVTLVSVDFLHEKGVTFKFQVTGDIRQSALKGAIHVDGKVVKLYCNDHGDPTPKVLTCTAQKATAARYAGRPAVVTLAGFNFYFVIPARP